MTTRHKPLSSDRPSRGSPPADEDRGRDPGAVRPGEGRFDARAWRQATLAEPEIKVQDSGLIDPPLVAKRRDEVDRAPAAVVAAAASAGDVRPADMGARWRYLAVWAVLGSVSAAYVAGMAWQRSANFEVVMAPVTETLERLANDLADLRQTTTALDQREQATAARVSATESRINRFAEVAAPMSPSSSAPQQTALAAPAQAATTHGQRPTNRGVLAEEASVAGEAVRPQRVMAGVVLAAPGTPPGLIVGPAPAKAEPKPEPRAAAAGTVMPKPSAPTGTVGGPVNGVRTGTLAEAPPAAGAQPAPRARPGLLIASGPSLDSVRLSWNVLSQNHGAVLGPVEPRIMPAGDGSAFQLIAGPYATEADAAKACSNLRARGVTCRPADYAGASL